MDQKKADKIFSTGMGVQLSELFSTSDGRCFIRWEEANLHRQGKLDPDTQPLEDQEIKEWYPSDDLVYDYEQG